MTFDKTEEHGLLRDTVAKFLAANYDIEKRRTIAASREGWSREIWREFADLGLVAAAIPEVHGGLAQGPEEMLLVMEELGRRLVLEPFSETAIVSAFLIAELGSEAQRSVHLPAIMAGETIWAFAHEEDGTTGEGHAAMVAETVEGGYRLAGRKVLAAAAGWADRLLVSARVVDEGGRDAGPSLFIVDPAGGGVALDQLRTLDGRDAADIRIADMLLPPEAMLGPRGSAGAAIEGALDRAVAAQCAEAVGIMAVLNAATLDFVKVREQFGQPIGRFQALQHRLVDMYIAETEARGIAGTLAGRFDGSNRSGAIISAAKVRIAETGRLVAEEAIQIHGGMGMTQELSVGDYAKRLVAITIQHGDVRMHLDRFVALELGQAA